MYPLNTRLLYCRWVEGRKLFNSNFSFKADHPNLANRDRLLLSKGHAGIGLYGVLAYLNYFDKNELNFLNQESILGEHPDHLIPGVEFLSGSLGHGLSLASGMSLADQIDGKSNKNIVILGISILGVCILVNLPWIMAQLDHDPNFFPQFLNDNLLRFFRDHPGDVSRQDYYGFFLYALISLFPWTPLFLAGISRSFFKDYSSALEKVLIVSILPCLIIFSLSGITLTCSTLIPLSFSHNAMKEVFLSTVLPDKISLPIIIIPAVNSFLNSI